MTLRRGRSSCARRRSSPSPRRCSAGTWPRSTATADGARRPRLRPGRAAHLPRLRRRPRARAALDRLRVLAARVQRRRRARRSTCCSGSRRRCRSTRPTSPAWCPHLAFNTAVSFVTNTNWQSYAGETTMSHLTQMARPDGAELRVRRGRHGRRWSRSIRGLARRRLATLGNFWVDLTRTTIRILLPLSFVFARRAGQPGRDPELRRLRPTVTTRRGRRRRSIPGGPGASQDRHQAARHQRRRVLQRQLRPPVREPDGVHQLPRDLRASLVIPFALAFTFGAHGRRQAAGLGGVRASWSSSGSLRVAGAMALEANGNPNLDAAGVDQSIDASTQPGGNMEGKEVRFGAGRLGAVGGVDHRHLDRLPSTAMHDSYHAARRRRRRSST